MLTWRQFEARRRATSRLSVSDSASPRRTAAMQSATRSPTVGEVERPVAGAEHAEVLHPGVAVAAEQARRDLLDHAQAEVLERRHRLAQLDLAAGLVERDARAPAARSAARRRTARSLALEPVEALDVADHHRRVDRRAVVLGEARAPVRRQLAPARRAEAVDEPLAQAVLPRARERDQLLLELAQRHVRHAVGHVHGGVHAHALALAEHRVRVDRVGARSGRAAGCVSASSSSGVVARGGQRRRSATPSARRTTRRPSSRTRSPSSDSSATTARRRSSLRAENSSSFGNESNSETAAL